MLGNTLARDRVNHRHRKAGWRPAGEYAAHTFISVLFRNRLVCSFPWIKPLKQYFWDRSHFYIEFGLRRYEYSTNQLIIKPLKIKRHFLHTHTRQKKAEICQFAYKLCQFSLVTSELNFFPVNLFWHLLFDLLTWA